MKLDTYIREEWLDYPSGRIDGSCGLDYAKWLYQNDREKYEEVVDDYETDKLKDDLLMLFICDRDTESVSRLSLEILFRDSLIDEIQDYKNCYEDESEQDGESYDAQRLM